MLDGTALSGGAIGLIDSLGHSASVQANSSGRFKLDTAGMTAPFLLSASSASGDVLYGVGLAPGVANIDVYTDLILNLIYGAQAAAPAAQFASATPLMPTSEQLQLVGSLVQNAINTWLQNNRVKSATFNFFTKHFSATPHHFGEVLRETHVTSPFSNNSETILITNGPNSESITFTADSATGEITASVSATIGGNSTSFLLHTSVPTPAQSGLIDGIDATLAQ
jgi:hypothetical protein